MTGTPAGSGRDTHTAATTPRKVELWQLAEGEGVYSWMVFDVDTMQTYFYEDVDGARERMAALRAER